MYLRWRMGSESWYQVLFHTIWLTCARLPAHTLWKGFFGSGQHCSDRNECELRIHNCNSKVGFQPVACALLLITVGIRVVGKGSWKEREVGKLRWSWKEPSEVGKNRAKLEVRNFPSSAKLSNFKRNFLTSLGSFQLRWVLSNFARFFPTSLGSFQLQRNFPTSDFPTWLFPTALSNYTYPSQ